MQQIDKFSGDTNMKLLILNIRKIFLKFNNYLKIENEIENFIYLFF